MYNNGGWKVANRGVTVGEKREKERENERKREREDQWEGRRDACAVQNLIKFGVNSSIYPEKMALTPTI